MKNKKLTLLLANMGIVIASQASLAKVDSRESGLDIPRKSLPLVAKDSDENFSERKQALQDLQIIPNNMSKPNHMCLVNATCQPPNRTCK